MTALRLALVPLMLFTVACGGISNIDGSSLPDSVTLYCRLLHVPSPSPAVNSPKPYLGAYLEAQVPTIQTPPCRDGAFVRIAGVIAGTPAERAGLQEGDIVVTIDGRPACFSGGDAVLSFKSEIESRDAESVVSLEVSRKAEILRIAVRLSQVPTRPHREAVHPEPDRCINEDSAVLKAIAGNESLFHVQDVLRGLYERTNLLANPDIPDDVRYDALQLSEVSFLMRHPLQAGEVAGQLTDRMSDAAGHFGPDTLSVAAALMDVDPVYVRRTSDITFPALLEIISAAGREVERLKSGLSQEELLLLRETALAPWNDPRWNMVLDTSLKVDRKALFDSFLPLFSFLERENLSLLRQDIVSRFGDTGKTILYEVDTDGGKVIVGGEGANLYRDDAALILDLGGNDIYLNNAAGTRPGMPVSLVIDWGGDDEYFSRDDFSQGAGLIGGGILVDLGGRDRFIANRGSQGAGFFGLGILYHAGEKAIYESHSLSQAIGMMGVGLLIDRQGDDSYSCLHAGQGLGLFGGAGVLIDGAGDDSYRLGGLRPDFRDPARSTESMGQGFGYGIMPDKGRHGVPGGTGMLVDGNGSDSYIADYFAQGAAYYYGMGILSDRNGNDRYSAGRYAQAAGIHSSVGILTDGNGDDLYTLSYGVGQGTGHDFGVGFLYDNAGDDRFVGGVLVQAAATNGSFGLLMHGSGSASFDSGTESKAFVRGRSGIGILVESGRESPESGVHGTPVIRIGTGRAGTDE